MEHELIDGIDGDNLERWTAGGKEITFALATLAAANAEPCGCEWHCGCEKFWYEVDDGYTWDGPYTLAERDALICERLS